MTHLDRIVQTPGIMGGRPCIKGLRVTVSMILNQVIAGHRFEDILLDYPYLEEEDILQAIRFVAWRAEERDAFLDSA